MVFRTHDGQRGGLEYNIDSIRSGEAPDPPLQNGDVVVVPTSTGKFIFQSLLKTVPVAANVRSVVP
jgi:polysaccharide export outer membrane protein